MMKSLMKPLVGTTLTLALALVMGCSAQKELKERTVTPLSSSGGVARSADARFEVVFTEGAFSSATEVIIDVIRDSGIGELKTPVYAVSAASGAGPAKPAQVLLSAKGVSGDLLIVEVDGTSLRPVPSQHDKASGILTASLTTFKRYAAIPTTAVYRPCANKACGDRCTICDPNDTSCNEDAVVKQCNAAGVCKAAPATCGKTPYNPCANKKCGDSCKLCDPNDPNCNETAVVKLCNAAGQCLSLPPSCGGAYDPCANKKCGDSCKLCDPNDTSCNEDAVVKQCTAEGICKAAPATCGETSYDPCANKKCGDSCKLCDPNDPNCTETGVLKQCTAEGICKAAPATCGETSYDPCANKKCGDSCKLCDPNDSNCDETMVVKVCDANGKCTPNPEACN
jgi:hypothetical protein